MRTLTWQLLWAAILLCTAAMWIPPTNALTRTNRRVLQYSKGDPLGRLAVQILIDFKTAVTDDPNNALAGWNADDPHPCGWRGVACDPMTNVPTVIALEIPDQQLEGVIPPGLSGLHFLQRLDLSGNRLGGSIPREIGNLTQLSFLAFTSNNLTGEIPSEIGQLSALQILQLDNNELVGVIPDTIGRLSELQSLDLADNGLGGSIPISLSNCSKLLRLGLQRNSFAGAIPPELSLLVNMEILSLHDNHLTGEIPSELGGLPQLIVLNLAHNNLTGLIPAALGQLTSLRVISLGDNAFDVQEVPPWLSSLVNLVELHFFLMNLKGDLMPLLVNLPELEVIDCWGNRLTGTIPPEVGNLRNLTTLDLTANELRGGIPHEIGLLHRLRGLHLWGTSIGGQFPASMGNLSSLSELVVEQAGVWGRLPPEFGRMKNMRRLCIPYNKLEGPVPETLSNLTNLVHIRAQGNLFSGKLSVDFSRMPMLNRLDLSDNQLEGFLPTSMVGCPLYLLNLSANHFQGQIPALYGNLSSLQMLILDGNRLTGSIPSELMRATMLGDIRMASNHLSGSIPEKIGNLRFLYYLHLQDNHLTGEIPLSLSQCINLVDLNLADNFLTGPIDGKGFQNFSESLVQLVLSNNLMSGIIPPELGELQKLQILDLSGNNFTGTIPASLGLDKALQTIDLGHNNLQGQIPASLGELQDLVSLDVSSNNLTGSIPNTGIFMKIPASAYSGNPNLCGAVLSKKCAGEPTPCRGTTCKKVWIPIAATVPLAILLGVACYIGWLVLFSGRSKQGETMMKMQFGPRVPRKFTVHDLHLATNGFDSDNVLGTGARSTVYKGKLASGSAAECITIALKVLTVAHRHDAKAMAEISGEVQTLLKLKHINIVNLLGFCFHEKMMALMLEFMPNGSLHDHLHRNPRNPLSWDTRMDIVLGVANGMVYLHEEASEPVIHCDLKPSNILLDSNFQAQISDFGISKLTDWGQEELSVSCLNGTRGYIPPEYATSPKVSTKGDVYSYGVVLLEILTGKQPLNKTFLDEGYVQSGIVGWVAEASKNDFKKVLDSTLLEEANETSLVQMGRVLEVAKMCTHENPRYRPTMRKVVDVLLQIRKSTRQLTLPGSHYGSTS